MKFSRDEKLLLIILCVYTLAASMVTTFANVYLLTYAKSLVVLSIYSCIRYGMIGVFALFSAKLSTKIRMSYSLTIGLVLITSAVLFLLSVKERIGTELYLIYIIGFVWGGGEGFFWVTVNSLQQMITRIESRGLYLGISGVLSNAATIIAPLLSAFILSLGKEEIQGYYMLFQLAIAIFVCIAILSFFLKAAGVGRKFKMMDSFTSIKQDLHWRYVMTAQFFWGFREAATLSLTGLLIYSAIGNGTEYGRWLSMFAVLATISNYFCGRVVKKKNRIRLLTIGSLGIFMSGMALLLGNRTGAAIHGVMHYAFLAWAATPFSVISMNVVSEYALKENLVGRTLAREIVIAAGRMVGLSIIIVITSLIPSNTGLNIGMVVLYCGCLVFVAVNRHYHRVSNIQ